MMRYGTLEDFESERMETYHSMKSNSNKNVHHDIGGEIDGELCSSTGNSCQFGEILTEGIRSYIFMGMGC